MGQDQSESDRKTTDRIRGALDINGMVSACQEMVRTPSLSMQEADAARVLADLLMTLSYSRVQIDDKGNVIAWIDGLSDGPTLMFNGHLDHVPPGEMVDPYAGHLVDAARWSETGQVIYGRGTCDMKCNIIAGAFAGAALMQVGIKLAGSVVFVADVAEEIDSPDGVAHVIASGTRADYGLSAESTNLQVYLGHRGKVEFELTVFGRPSHASEPSAGRNAVVMMMKVIEALETLSTDLDEDPLLGKGSLAIIDITARPGGGVAVVPDRCTIRVDRRFGRSDSPESCRRELEEIVERLRQEDPEFRCEVEQVNLYPLMYIEPEHPLVAAAQDARAAVIGDPGELGAWRFGVNGTFMAQAGIPTVGFGPGHERWAHTVDEHIRVDDLVTAAEVYAQMFMGICGVAV